MVELAADIDPGFAHWMIRAALMCPQWSGTPAQIVEDSGNGTALSCLNAAVAAGLAKVEFIDGALVVEWGAQLLVAHQQATSVELDLDLADQLLEARG